MTATPSPRYVVVGWKCRINDRDIETPAQNQTREQVLETLSRYLEDQEKGLHTSAPKTEFTIQAVVDEAGDKEVRS